MDENANNYTEYEVCIKMVKEFNIWCLENDFQIDPITASFDWNKEIYYSSAKVEQGHDFEARYIGWGEFLIKFSKYEQLLKILKDGCCLLCFNNGKFSLSWIAKMQLRRDVSSENKEIKEKWEFIVSNIVEQIKHTIFELKETISKKYLIRKVSQDIDNK